MSTQIKFNWLLLGFMGCLLGLGPAGHHIGFLGLHPHGHVCDPSHVHRHGHATEGVIDASSEKVKTVDAAANCSCEDHAAAKDRQLDGVVSDVTQNDIGTETDACRFCKFFDDFQVVIFSWGFAPAVYPSSFFPAESNDSIILSSVPQSARGPPSIA